MEEETSSGFRINFFDRRIDDTTGEYVGGGTIFVRPAALGAITMDQALTVDDTLAEDAVETTTDTPEQ